MEKEISINYGVEGYDGFEVKGSCTVWQETIGSDDKSAAVKIKGALQLKEYISDIQSIGFKWNDKVVMIFNVNVFKETFGSDDETCLYEFTSKDSDIKVESINGRE